MAAHTNGSNTTATLAARHPEAPGARPALDARARSDHGDPAAQTTIGRRIALSREAAGLSVADAALRLGVMPATWRGWETGRTRPRSNRLAMLAGVLGVGLSWLLSGQGSGPADRASGASADLVRAMQQTSGEIAALNRRMQDIAASLERS